MGAECSGLVGSLHTTALLCVSLRRGSQPHLYKGCVVLVCAKHDQQVLLGDWRGRLGGCRAGQQRADRQQQRRQVRREWHVAYELF